MISSRNQGAQEVCFLLLGLQLYKGTRIVLSVDCRPPLDQNRLLVLNEEDPDDTPPREDFKRGKSYWTKYLERPLHYKDVTFFIALTNYELRGTTIRGLLRGALRLLSYYSKYKNNPADLIYKDYCRTWVVLLEGLQRVYPTLLVTLRYSINNHTFATYSDAYRQCRRYYKHYPDLYIALLQKLLREVQARIDAEDFEERLDKEDADPAYQNELNIYRSQYNSNALSNRDIDLNADQTSFVSKYATLFPNIYNHPRREYQKEEVTANPAELRVNSQSTSQKDLLNPEQRLVYNTVVNYYISFLDSQGPPQLLLNVDSRARTGKSYVINLISAYLQTKAALCRNLVLRLAPTSVAAYTIDSQTLYKLLKLPISSRRHF